MEQQQQQPGRTQEEKNAIRFFKTLMQLPMEIQMLVCNRIYDVDKPFISSALIESELKILIQKERALEAKA